MTEVPNNGYSFSSWSGDGTGTGATRIVTITGNMSVTTTFTQITYSVSFVTTGGGSGSSTNPSGTNTYSHDQQVSISAIAGSGYSFSSWIASGSITFADANSAFTTATINGDGNITAQFIQATPNLTPTPLQTPTSIPQNSPSPTPKPSPKPIPTSITITATANDGSNVSLVLHGNITGSTVSSATITTDQSKPSTTISLAVIAQETMNGFGNVSIPKTAVASGVTPTAYINNEIAPVQGYTQDAANYYVSYKTSYPIYELTITFTVTPVPFTFPFWVLFSIVIIVMLAVVVVFIQRSAKRKALKT